MAADDLSAPLGGAPISKRRKLPVAPAMLLAGALGLVLAVFVGWAIFVSDPQGGEPSATVALSPSGAPAVKVDAGAAPPTPADARGKPDVAAHTAPATGKASGDTVTIIDGTTGKRT